MEEGEKEVSESVFTFVGIAGVLWLYIRLYLSVLRTEKHTKESSEHLKRMVELAERRAFVRESF